MAASHNLVGKLPRELLDQLNIVRDHKNFYQNSGELSKKNRKSNQKKLYSVYAKKAKNAKLLVKPNTITSPKSRRSKSLVFGARGL